MSDAEDSDDEIVHEEIVDEDHLVDREEESEHPPETRAELLLRDDDSDGDEPVAEGDAPVPRAALEPSYAKCDAIPFAALARAMESCSRSHRGLKEIDRLQRLLPATLLDYLLTHRPDSPPESIYPLLRLLIPERDSSRFISLKESLLAGLYVDAFDLQGDSDKLKNYGNPLYFNSAVGSADLSAVGDFSAVLEQCLLKKGLEGASSFTVGDVNACLDKLRDIKSIRKTGHDWKSASPSKKAKPPTLKSRRVEWLERLRLPPDRTPLSALEHKWLVRIILRKMQLGVGPTKLFNWYDPRAMDLWNARSSLKRLCRDLAFSSVEPEVAQKGQGGCLPYLFAPEDGLEFGTEFDPMRSERTGFEILLTNISGRHRNHFESQADAPLAAIHPAFTVETKLDGERMLVHFRRDGVVRIHSRSHVWYSKLYSPVLGPALRRALEHHQCDIILDGEVLAWDNARRETVPFGNNRTIAALRRNWMERQGMLDKRDLTYHIGEEGGRAVKVAESRFTGNEGAELSLAGEQCWLQFVAFDVLYVNGPGAEEVIRSVVSSSVSPSPSPGSLIGLDCMERKKLLYRLIEVQQDEVEIVDTHVIRPNGVAVPGKTYFSTANESVEYGYPMYTVDSIACCIRGEVSDLSTVDARRRQLRSDDEISQARARAVSDIYIHYVENRREEGLIFKDLSTFYVLGEHHRSKRYWLKFKPDYFNGSSASDVDLVIVGAYFASGLRSAGQPSSFLCACVHSQDSQCFLPVTKVNARSVKDDDYQRILSHTGYSFTPGLASFGKWDPGEPPSEVTWDRSKAKADTPDLWIRPQVSVVVTLNAGEIVPSDSFPTDLTLRFPRITRLRMDGDAKEPYDIESDAQLRQRFDEVAAQRRAAVLVDFPSFESSSDSLCGCRFLTESQSSRQKKQTRATEKPQFQPLVPVVAAETRVLERKAFVVLEGRYCVHDDEIDLASARLQGWYDDAAMVESHRDVQAFIKRHGGIVRLAPLNDIYVLGGMWGDVRVLAHGNERVKGIVRWTYVYRMVTQLKAAAARVESGQESFVKETIKPTILDFLVPCRETSDSKSGSVGADPNAHRFPHQIGRSCTITDRLELMRALQCVGQDRLSRTSEEAIRDTGFPPRSRHGRTNGALQDTISPMRRLLWPGGVKNLQVVLYPDIFRDDFGFHEESGAMSRLDDAESSRDANRIHRAIPVALAMGATVTSHLHSGVTHVLCSIGGSRGWTIWSQEANAVSLGIRESLVDRLLLVCSDRERQVVLVSPQYLSKVFLQ